MKELMAFIDEYDLIGKARACYQCGTCTGGCQVWRLHPQFNPRQIVDLIVRGEIQALLRNPNIWLCSHCQNCLEHCPQGIEVSLVLVHLKNAAARMGAGPVGDLKIARTIMATGWADNPVSRTARQREKLFLPPSEPGITPADLQNLADSVGWVEEINQFSDRSEQVDELRLENKKTRSGL